MHRTDASGHVNNRYTNGAPGQLATAQRAQEWNSVQEEMCYFIEKMGLTLNTSSEQISEMTHLYQAVMLAIQGSILTCTGAPNGYVVTGVGLTGPYTHGLTVRFQVGAGLSNTAAPCTLNADAQGAEEIRWPNGDAIGQAQILKAGSIVTCVWDDTNGYWQLTASSMNNVLAIMAEVILAREGKDSLKANLEDNRPIARGFVKITGGAVAGTHHTKNVLEVTRSAIGQYNVTFVNALADVNYIVQVSSQSSGNTMECTVYDSLKATTGFRVSIKNDQGNWGDPEGGFSFVIYGALAA